jgi:hypothetical protein
VGAGAGKGAGAGSRGTTQWYPEQAAFSRLTGHTRLSTVILRRKGEPRAGRFSKVKALLQKATARGPVALSSKPFRISTPRVVNVSI